MITFIYMLRLKSEWLKLQIKIVKSSCTSYLCTYRIYRIRIVSRKSYFTLSTGSTLWREHWKCCGLKLYSGAISIAINGNECDCDRGIILKCTWKGEGPYNVNGRIHLVLYISVILLIICEWTPERLIKLIIVFTQCAFGPFCNIPKNSQAIFPKSSDISVRLFFLTSVILDWNMNFLFDKYILFLFTRTRFPGNCSPRLG